MPANQFKPSALFKRVIANTSLGLFGAVVVLFVSIGRMVLLTKEFSIHEFGLIMITVNFFAFFNMICDAKVNVIIFRHLPDFQKNQDSRGEHALVNFSILITLGLCLISILVVFGFNSLVSFIYNSPNIASLIQFYAVGGVLYPMMSFSTGILRINNKFKYLVFPQAGFTLLSLAALYLYINQIDQTSIELIVLIMGVGTGLTYLVPFILALTLLKGQGHVYSIKGLSRLKDNWQLLRDTLVQTNLAGYLKIGSTKGGVFLLGVFATPSQVALYNVAAQMVRPMTMLQNNVQPAIFPEIVKLYNQSKIRRLISFVQKSTALLFGIGLVLVLIGITCIRPVLELFTTSEYFASVPIFHITIWTSFVTFFSLCFYPLTIVMDKMKRRNLVVSFTFVLIIASLFYGFNALTLAIAQLAGAIINRLFSDLLIYKNLISNDD